MNQGSTYPVQCWHCLAEFDAVGSVWCSCSASNPTKLCPFCLSCFCSAAGDYQEAFWRAAPPPLLEERETLRRRRRLLGDMLLAANRITTDQLIVALRRQTQTGEKLGASLIALGFIDEATLRSFLENQYAPIAFELRGRVVNASLSAQVGVEYCVQHRVLPVEIEVFNDRSMVLLAMADPSDLAAIDCVASVLDAHVIPGFVPERILMETFADLYPTQIGTAALAVDDAEGLARRLLEGAVRCRSTHVQMEATPALTRVSYRIDGVLYRIKSTPASIDRRHLETLAGWLRGADGDRFLDFAGRHVLLRASEVRLDEVASLTMELRDPAQASVPLETASLDRGGLAAVDAALAAASGLVLLAGPAHSGSEVTFWGLANRVLAAGRDIALFDAPLSHPSPRARQGAALIGCGLDNPAAGSALAAHAGQAVFDFDAERRPAAVVSVSERSLAFARLTRRDALASLARLDEAGVPRRALASTLRVLIQQRSVRRVCSGCISPVEVSSATLRRFGLSESESGSLNVFRGRGCSTCSVTPGYHGREPLYEVIGVSPALAALIARGASGADLTEAAERAGMRTMREACLDLVHRGLTTVEEFQKANLRGRVGARLAPSL